MSGMRTNRRRQPRAWLIWSLAGAVLSMCLPLPNTLNAAQLSASTRGRAKVIATEAIYEYRAKRYSSAAKRFMRVWDLTGHQMPRMLRNAAKSYEAAGNREKALQIWDKLQRPVDKSDLTRKETALLRKEARIHVRDLRLVMGQQVFERAEQRYSQRKFRAAGDAFIEAYSVSDRQTPSYLRFAARAYQKGRLFDEALLGWRHYGAAKRVGAIGREEARKQQVVLRREVDSLLRNKEALAHYRKGRFAAAAAAFLSAYQKAPHKRLPQLRMSAMCFQRANDHPSSRHLWRQYGAARKVTRLGRQEAEDQIRAIDMEMLSRSAAGYTRARKHKQAGDKWLELYAKSLDKNPAFLHKAAISFESAKAYKVARTMWLRYSTAPTVSDDDQDRAHKRAEQLKKPGKSGKLPPPPAPDLGVGSLSTAQVGGGTCTGCLVALGLGATVAVGGMVFWAAAEDQATQLRARLNVTNNGITYGTDLQTAQTQEDEINNKRTAGLALMGVGGAALLIGSIAQVVSGRSSDVASGFQLELVPVRNGVMAVFGGAL